MLTGNSRMMREYPVRICEGLGVKFPGPTRRVSTVVNPRRAASLSPCVFNVAEELWVDLNKRFKNRSSDLHGIERANLLKETGEGITLTDRLRDGRS